MNTTHKGGPDSQAAIDAELLVSRCFPDRRAAERRAYTSLDTRVDFDLTNPNVAADRRHQERRFASIPAQPSAFGAL